MEVSHPEWLPFRFRLIVEANGVDVECEIAHRTDNAVGVRFSAPVSRTR